MSWWSHASSIFPSMRRGSTAGPVPEDADSESRLPQELIDYIMDFCSQDEEETYTGILVASSLVCHRWNQSPGTMQADLEHAVPPSGGNISSGDFQMWKSVILKFMANNPEEGAAEGADDRCCRVSQTSLRFFWIKWHYGSTPPLPPTTPKRSLSSLPFFLGRL
ncbi:hypothetical protein T439DRAFT_381195 [Meredithblackwellia eburnea MCA 4105]